MNFPEMIRFLMEATGAVAFACSGSLLAIRKKMDLLGICIMGVVTAVGGGMLTDIILGIHPPALFRQPGMTALAALTSVVVFLIAKSHVNHPEHTKTEHLGKTAMLIADTIGLAAFTVAGVSKARVNGYDSLFLLVFLGTLTGTGGGLIRDLLAQEPPYIFTKHIYASAAILGSLVCALLYDVIGEVPASAAGCAVVIIIRALASHFRWNLPRVSDEA